jgi:hypothetical protein
VADIAIRMMRTGERPRKETNTSDGQGTTEKKTAGADQSGATPAPTPDTDRPADVLPEEWREHKAIMRAIKEWKLEHAEDEPFLDPDELRDTRVREWREKLRQTCNFNLNDNEQ